MSAAALAQAPAHKARRWYQDGCGAAQALELMGERWSLLIARELLLGARRFNEIRAALPGLSAKILSERLETLEASGVVQPCLLPPPVSARAYGLTQWGQGLEDVLCALVRWAYREGDVQGEELPLTPVALMLALRSWLVPERIGKLDLWVAFDIAEQRFAARVRASGMTIHPGGAALRAPELRFTARTARDLHEVLFSGAERDVPEKGLRSEGDPALADRFAGLFAQAGPKAL
ncbi:winged helix-turn-helix transcriptional regulator [Novosphingobium decolorationis]|uniref:Helix-turn-helix transcriptional regulator n=1 Tax=Novosphingobium decolorationis TaxID=2698673 RepID=A0ABX8E1W0_9SPHN|nr:helix-turn-helix domain-containing protein [Novosphingobium decolorationis]QVM82898.1 helix-turn-helix transcriptional regulator [Novosphingobium decolorationis]